MRLILESHSKFAFKRDLIYIVIQNQSPIKMKTEVVCLFINRYVYIQSSLFRRGC